MSSNQKEKQTWSEKLQHIYRLVVMNDETFEEVGSYRLTLLNIYLFASSLLVVTALFIMLLIIFTPLKQWIPGYGDVNLRDDAERLALLYDKQYEQYQADSTYISNVQKWFAADFETEAGAAQDSLTLTEMDAAQDVNVERIAEDEALRNAVERDESIVEIEESKAEEGSSKFIPNAVRPIEQLFFVAPVRGEVSSGFRPDKKHWGVDLLAPKNTPIKAVMDGVVIFSDWTQETGHSLAIQHDNNLVTFYKHNSTLLKKVGNPVKSGEAIAIIGNTGTLSSGPHLHFELWYSGNPVDPVDYISFN